MLSAPVEVDPKEAVLTIEKPMPRDAHRAISHRSRRLGVRGESSVRLFKMSMKGWLSD